MPGTRKYFEKRKVHKITFSTEEDLPFVPVQFMNEIIWSAVAKAQDLYYQEVVSLTFEANHCHMDIVCCDHETVPAFVGYIKQESSHAVNRLLGRKKKTIWAEGYDSPPILDADRFLASFAYNVLNPVKDKLVSHMELYSGVSTYKHLMKNKTSRQCMVISRNSIPKMNNPQDPLGDNSFIMRILKKLNKKKLTVKLNFTSWKDSFPETENLSQKQAYQLLVDTVIKAEERLQDELGIKYSDYKPSTVESMTQRYQPKKTGKKMICLASCKEKRKEFIAYFRALSDKARNIYLNWKKGDYSEEFPPGMFAPCMPRICQT